jgi:hypothetical protein
VNATQPVVKLHRRAPTEGSCSSIRVSGVLVQQHSAANAGISACEGGGQGTDRLLDVLLL